MASPTPISVHGVPYTIPPEPNKVPAIIVALLVHAGLLAFLWVGIKWQNVEPTAVEAEVWDMKTETAAPPPRAQAVRQPDPVPVPKVVPPLPPPPPPKVAEPVVPKVAKVAEPVAPKTPDIALEREKEKKKLLEKKLLEKKLADEKVVKEKAREVAELDAKEKALAEKKEKELAAKKEKALADKLLADKAKAEKAAKAAQDLFDEKLIQKIREMEMKRITGGMGNNGGAERATAPKIDAGYVAAITSKIKRSTSYNGDTDVEGNPRATFKIEQLPTGEIISVRKTKSSGIRAFDEAVERGINNSSPLPKKKDGTVERSIEVSILMKELD